MNKKGGSTSLHELHKDNPEEEEKIINIINSNKVSTCNRNSRKYTSIELSNNPGYCSIKEKCSTEKCLLNVQIKAN